MWVRGSSTLTLALVLVLASTVGLAGHEHAAGVERGAMECALDHGRPEGPWTGASDLELEAGGERHQHHCVGCRHGGHRGFVVPAPAAAEPGPDVAGSSAIVSLPPVSRPATDASPRGPPAA